MQVGTSSVVYPAAMFAPQVAARGVPVAEFNMENTPATMRFMCVPFLSHDQNCTSLSLTCNLCFMAQDHVYFCASGSTSTDPVGPHCRPRWRYTRWKRVKYESWASAAHRPDCRTLEDFVGINNKKQCFEYTEYSTMKGC